MLKISNDVIKLEDNQLRWFLNKLISLSKNPITLQSYDETICFPVDLLRKEETGLFPLGKHGGSTEFDSEDQEYAQYCKEMLQKIKSDIYKLENKGVRFNEERFSWEEDDNNYFGYGYAFFIDCYNKTLFETYLRFINDDKTEPETTNENKYSEANEDIFLKTLGITIKGNYMLRGKDKTKINSTDKALIYYLFYKSTKNEDECFTLQNLSEAEEIKKTKKYIENRIIFINQSIRKIISKEVRVRIPKFIEKERSKRGYHLNPKILLIKQRK